MQFIDQVPKAKLVKNLNLSQEEQVLLEQMGQKICYFADTVYSNQSEFRIEPYLGEKRADIRDFLAVDIELLLSLKPRKYACLVKPEPHFIRISAKSPAYVYTVWGKSRLADLPVRKSKPLTEKYMSFTIDYYPLRGSNTHANILFAPLSDHPYFHTGVAFWVATKGIAAVTRALR